MVRALQWVGQAVVYAAIALVVGYFATRPVYRQFPEDQAQIKLSFAHGAARREECRRLSPAEIAKLPPRERRPNTCSRERVPIHVQLQVGEETILDELLQPAGISSDGPGRIYRKFVVPPGMHMVAVRLRDSRGTGKFDYETQREITLRPGQNLAIDFKADAGGFIFR